MSVGFRGLSCCVVKSMEIHHALPSTRKTWSNNVTIEICINLYVHEFSCSFNLYCLEWQMCRGVEVNWNGNRWSMLSGVFVGSHFEAETYWFD